MNLVAHGGYCASKIENNAHLRCVYDVDSIEITVNHDIDSMADDWQSFQTRAAGTLYQTFEWCKAWIETAQDRDSNAVRIVVGRSGSDNIVFLLPFVVRATSRVRVLEWIGARQINYGYGLFDRRFLPGAVEWFQSRGWYIPALLDGVDAVRLNDMPEHLHGYRHPLAGWFTIVSANHSYRTALQENYDHLYTAKRSGETRRGNRKRDSKLEKTGELRFGLPSSNQETHELLEQMFMHQERRLAEAGIRDVFSPSERAFVHRLADTPGLLLPFHLSIDGELASMMLGAEFDDTYWALISSLNPEIAHRYSPGDAALRRMIEACCQRGLKHIDFSSGDTPYKSHWADEAIPLHETIRFLTWKGAFWAAGSLAATASKRTIKQSDILWPLFTWFRTNLRGGKVPEAY